MYKGDIKLMKDMVLKKLLEKTKYNKQNISFGWKRIISLLTFCVSLTLMFFDYITLTEVFNFSKASFLTIYFFNLSFLNVEFFLFVALIPVIFLIMIFLFSFISLYFPIQFSNSVKKHYIYNSYIIHLRMNLYFTFIFTILLIILSYYYYLFDNSNTSIISFVRISFFLSGIIGISYSGAYYIARDTFGRKFEFSSSDNFLFFILFSFLYLVFLAILNDKSYLFVGLYLFTIVLFGNLFFFDIILMNKLEIKRKHKNIIQSAGFQLLFIIFVIICLYILNVIYNENKNLWQNTQKQEFTFNLFLDKFFLSKSTHTISLDVKNIYIKECSSVLDSNTTTILPFSKTISLYFQAPKSNDKNISKCVYAIEKRYNKSGVNYNLLDIGYIFKNAAIK